MTRYFAISYLGTRFRGGLALCVLLAVAMGCDGIPQLPSELNVKPVQENVVASVGRGGYDWSYTEGKFEVIAPSDLAVFEKLDPDAVEASIPKQAFVERSEPYRPEGLDDDVYVTFSRLSEPYFDTRPSLTIPFSPTANGMFAIDADGSRLALLAEHLEVWDLPGSRIIEKYSLPSDTCNQVAWSYEPDELLVMDQSTIYCISATSGRTLRRWQPPDADAPAFFACAANSPATVVSTAQGRLYLVDEELRTIDQYTLMRCG